MELDFSRKEKIAGIFIISIIILLIATVITIGRGKDWFKTYVIYYTTFDESYNLKENAAVKLFKADIGKVKKITLVEDKVKVKLGILEEYSSRIRADSIAIVESPTFVGSEYVSLRPGSHDAPLIPEGGEIQSKPKRKLSDLMAEFQVEKTAKVVIKSIQDISEISEIMRSPNGPLFAAFNSINTILAHLEAVAGDIRAGRGTIGGLLESGALLEGVQKDLDKAGDILQNLSDATAKVPATVENVQASLATIKQIGDGVLDCIASVKKILKKIEEGSTDIPVVTESTKRGIREIRNGVQNIDRVVQSLQKNILIRGNLPPEPKAENVDAGLRQ